MSNPEITPSKHYQIHLTNSENYLTTHTTHTPVVSLLRPPTGWTLTPHPQTSNNYYLISPQDNPGLALTMTSNPIDATDIYSFCEVSLQKRDDPIAERQLWALDGPLEWEGGRCTTGITSAERRGYGLGVGGMAVLPRLYLGVVAVASGSEGGGSEERWTVEEC